MAIKAIAKVQLTIQIHLSQPWGEEASIGEAHRTAARQALDIARNLKGIEVVGEPAVKVVSFEES